MLLINKRNKEKIINFEHFNSKNNILNPYHCLRGVQISYEYPELQTRINASVQTILVEHLLWFWVSLALMRAFNCQIFVHPEESTAIVSGV